MSELHGALGAGTPSDGGVTCHIRKVAGVRKVLLPSHGMRKMRKVLGFWSGDGTWSKYEPMSSYATSRSVSFHLGEARTCEEEV